MIKKMIKKGKRKLFNMAVDKKISGSLGNVVKAVTPNKVKEDIVTQKLKNLIK